LKIAEAEGTRILKSGKTYSTTEEPKKRSYVRKPKMTDYSKESQEELVKLCTQKDSEIAKLIASNERKTEENR
jgi:hypothetical protein